MLLTITQTMYVADDYSDDVCCRRHTVCCRRHTVCCRRLLRRQLLHQE